MVPVTDIKDMSTLVTESVQVPEYSLSPAQAAQIGCFETENLSAGLVQWRIEALEYDQRVTDPDDKDSMTDSDLEAYYTKKRTHLAMLPPILAFSIEEQVDTMVTVDGEQTEKEIKLSKHSAGIAPHGIETDNTAYSFKPNQNPIYSVKNGDKEIDPAATEVKQGLNKLQAGESILINVKA